MRIQKGEVKALSLPPKNKAIMEPNKIKAEPRLKPLSAWIGDKNARN
jgi:hypothetical protein